MELPFAGLHQLMAGLLEGRERLPALQRDAVATAFGLSSGAQPDRFLVGLAVLSLLSEAAEAQPLVCLVDDVQWLDRSSAQVLAFVARRLAAESVVLLFAERDSSGLEELAGLPELRLGGLSDASARELLASVIAAPLDERVRARILAETRGNPLALLELPRESSAEGFAGGFELPGDGSLPDRIEASYPPTRGAAAGRRPRGCCSWRRPTRRETPRCSFSPRGTWAFRSTGCLLPRGTACSKLGPQVRFRHPLLRSAIYRAAPSDERRATHQSLAAATDPERDPDRRAWHRAHAIAEPDEERRARAGAFRRARPRTRRTRRRRGVPRAIGGAHARPGSPGPPHVGSRHQQAPGRRPPGGVAAAHERGGRADGPVGSSQAQAPARRDRGFEAHPGRAAVAPRRGQAARTA